MCGWVAQLKLLCKQLDIQVCPFCIFSVFMCCLTSVSLCCILLWKGLYSLGSSKAQFLLFWQNLFFQGLCVSLWLFIHQRAVCFVLEDCEVTWGASFSFLSDLFFLTSKRWFSCFRKEPVFGFVGLLFNISLKMALWFSQGCGQSTS